MLTAASLEPNHLLADFESLRALRGWEPTFLRSVRLRAFKSFANNGLPTTRSEEWRFTNVRDVANTSWDHPSEPGMIPVDAIAPWPCPKPYKRT